MAMMSARKLQLPVGEEGCRRLDDVKAGKKFNAEHAEKARRAQRKKRSACSAPLMLAAVKTSAAGFDESVLRLAAIRVGRAVVHFSRFVHDGDAFSGHQSEQASEAEKTEPAPVGIVVSVVPVVSSIVARFGSSRGRIGVRVRRVIVIVLRRDERGRNQQTQAHSERTGAQGFEQISILFHHYRSSHVLQTTRRIAMPAQAASEHRGLACIHPSASL